MTPLCRAQTDSFATQIRPILQARCLKCHGATDELEGDINLATLRGDSLRRDPELVRRLIRVVDQSRMPPEDEPPLKTDTRRTLVAQLKGILRAAVRAEKSYGHGPMRRMNRFQYNNAVVDLFDLKCIVFTLPERTMRVHRNYFRPETGRMADVVSVGNRPLGKSQMIEPRLAGVAAFPQDLRAEHGFDNRGDHLSLSPILMESFLKLGDSITRSPDFRPRTVGIWKSFFARPDETSDLRTHVEARLKVFLRRAFRRPVDRPGLRRYVDYAMGRIESGHAFPDAMKAVAAAVIASPRFLYLYDTAAKKSGAAAVGGYELASRLSFFLWGSLPDDRLLELAASGELTQRPVLEQEFNRMLKDRRLKRFCDSFPSQWLQLERIISSVPNREKFPGFYYLKYRDSMHMMLEPLLLFETVLIENLPITQLIDSDFTYRSGLLEQAYGPLASSRAAKKRGGGVTVLKFHRVPVTDRRMGGVITNAAVMTMLSGPERTKPITRGAWIATVIFNTPPDPPPADVPPLSGKPTGEEQALTLRERLSAHRARADCRGCHEQIDPLGFALENYDAIGVWRDEYENGRGVDVSGTLFRRHQFSDIIEFKDAILAEKKRFARGFAGHLLAFALARELTAADEFAVDRIAEAAAKDEYRMQAILKHIILSEPFLTKSNPRVAPGTPEKRRRSAESARTGSAG